MISVSIVQTDAELLGIVALMKKNLRSNFSPELQKSDGFLSIDYEFSYLKRMNQVAPSIIAKNSNDEVIGYALAVLPEVALESSDLTELLMLINELEYKNKPLQNYAYYIMGQVCVAKEFRGQNIFDQIMNKHREIYGYQYQLLITLISSTNTRSLRAHIRVGFEIIYSYKSSSTDEIWHVVLWDWNK